MTSVISLENSNRRRRLAALLRRLRALRQTARSGDQLLSQARAMITDAGEIGSYINVTVVPAGNARPQLSLVIDKDRFREAERCDLFQANYPSPTVRL